MDIPAHRAAAVVPTPAHTFELREGDQLVNLTEEERTAADASAADSVPASSTGGDQPAASTEEGRATVDSDSAAAAVAASTTEGDQPATSTGDEQTAADAAAAVPVRATKGRRPATDAPAPSAQTAE